MNSEKANQMMEYLQGMISENGEVLGNRAILNTEPIKEIITISKKLKLSAEEEVIIFFDDTFNFTGKCGLTITTWGIRYRTNIDVTQNFNLSWEELGDSYKFNSLGTAVELHNDKALINKKKNISLICCEFNNEWLVKVLLIGCKIMNGKDPYASIGETSVQNSNNNTDQNIVSETKKVKEEEADDDEMKYRVFNYGSGNASLPSINPDDEINEFQLYLKNTIAKSDLDSVKSRSILNIDSSKEITDIKNNFRLADNMKLAFFFDLSSDESRDYGIAITNWGLHYKFYGESKFLPWKELAEKYAIRTEGSSIEIVEPDGVTDEDVEPFMEVNLSQAGQAMLANVWLYDVICKGCDIFAKPINAFKNKDSIFKRNRGGVILAVVLVVIFLIYSITSEDIIGGKKIIVFLLSIIPFILSFWGCIIGNKIRLAIRPDYVFASGFMGLLKEKIFWRFIPQLIGAVIGWVAGILIILKIIGVS